MPAPPGSANDLLIVTGANPGFSDPDPSGGGREVDGRGGVGYFVLSEKAFLPFRF